ncbi:uncharacterized protein RB166_006849 isoform 1-T1 [Leptodactylus fuscus]
MGLFRSVDMRKLLHNKFVVILGDSIQRSVYKDLVKLLRTDAYLTEDQLKEKGELTFEEDTLVEGGKLGQMHNGTTFTEVRQYRSGHHLVRFYFLTRVYSTYLESILSDFQSGPQPDVLIVNSCVWDVNRYNDHHLEAYKNNLDSLFLRLKEVLSPECLIIWSMTMPVGYRDYEMPEGIVHNLKREVIEGNFFSATLANFHKLDVLDMHFHFRGNLHLRCRDVTHWNQLAHRKYTQILLSHIAKAWGVGLPKGKMPKGLALLPTPQMVPLNNHPRYEIQEQELFSQGSSVHPRPPHMFHLENPCPRPMPPPFLEEERLMQGSSVHPRPPHMFPPHDDPCPRPMPPPFQEEERLMQGSSSRLPHMFPLEEDPCPRPMRPPFLEEERLMQGSSSRLPHMFPLEEDPCPRPMRPPFLEEERLMQGSSSRLPHMFPLEEDPCPRPMRPPFLEEERLMQGSSSRLPHMFPLEEDPCPRPMRPPFLEEERLMQGSSSRLPHMFPLEQDPCPRPMCPPFLEEERLLQGPAFPPFAGKNFLLPNLPQSMNFSPFPLNGPYPQEDWNRKMMSRRGRSRGLLTHPYPRPPM